jgi:hypothetical protein
MESKGESAATSVWNDSCMQLALESLPHVRKDLKEDFMNRTGIRSLLSLEELEEISEYSKEAMF